MYALFAIVKKRQWSIFSSIKCDITKIFWGKYSEWRYNASRKPENLTTENIMLGISISELPVEENL